MLQIRPEQLTELYRQRAAPRRQGCILEMNGAWRALSPRWEDRFIRPPPSDEDRHAFFGHVFDRCAESGVEDKSVVIGAAVILLRAAQQGWHSHEVRHGLFLVCGSDDPAMHLRLLEYQVAGPSA